MLQGRDGHSRSKTPQRAVGLAKDTACTKGLLDCGVTSNSAIHAQGPQEPPVQSLLPCSQKDGASLTHRGAGAPCPVGCHPESRVVLRCPLSSSMPPVRPHIGGAVVVSVFPWEITAALDSTPQPNKRSSSLWQHKDISANI